MELTTPQVVDGVYVWMGDGQLTKSGEDASWYRKVRKMRKDPTIALARRLVVAPALAANWIVESREDADSDMVSFVDATMQRLRTHIVRTAMYGAIDFGWQPYEKIFKYDEVTGWVTLKKLKPLLQDLTTILVKSEDGSYHGLRQRSLFGDYIDIPRDDTLLVSFDVEGTDWYGEALMRAVEEAYDAWARVEESSTKYDKKVAGSRWVIKYPYGTSFYDGRRRDNFEIAKIVLASLTGSGSVVIPATTQKVVDDLEADNPGWEIKLESDTSSASSNFISRAKYLDALKVRGLGLPERAVLEGQFGTKAEAEAHADFAVTNIEQRHQYLCQHVTWHLVDQIVVLNLGEAARGSISVRPEPLSDAQRGILRSVYADLLRAPQMTEEMMRLDWDALRDANGVPAASEDVIAAREAAAQPPAPEPEPVPEPVPEEEQEVEAALLELAEALLLRGGANKAWVGVPVPDPLREDILELGREFGGAQELEPHITIVYGLSNDTTIEDLRRVANSAGIGTFEVTLGKTGYFEPDVLYIEVESPQLRQLNQWFTALLPNEPTHPVYTPHITLAKVRDPQRFAGRTELEGVRFTASELQLTGGDTLELMSVWEYPMTPADREEFMDALQVVETDEELQWLLEYFELPVHLELGFNPKQKRDAKGRWAKVSSAIVRSPDGKSWQMADGSPLPKHVQGVKIPPAWTDVRIANDPKSALLVKGRDAKGRLQPVYSKSHTAKQAAKKFVKVTKLRNDSPKLIAQNQKDLKSKDPAVSEPAAVLSLIMATGLRPGSERDTKAAKKAYGATTLEGRHVKVRNGKVTLEFTGKKGVSLAIPVDDPALATMLKQRKKAAGTDGRLFEGSYRDLNKYTKTLTKGQYNPKDFRTARGTSLATEIIKTMPAPKNAEQYASQMKEVAVKVSSALGNTPVVALQSYIDPSVFTGWRILE